MLDKIKLGEGRMAEVFTWNDGQVIKLFFEHVPMNDAIFEARVAHVVQEAGLPVPAVGEIVEEDGRRGIIYQRINGPTMFKSLLDKPWRCFRYARTLADLQIEIHCCSGKSLPSQRERLTEMIDRAEPLSSQQRDQILAALNHLPDGQQLCHGDFHVDNIILAEDDDYIIDWPAATCGHPLGDVAYTAMLLRLSEPPYETPRHWLINRLRASFHRTYTRRYLTQIKTTSNDLDRWALPVAAARLCDDIPGEQPRLLALIDSLLSRI